MDVQVILIAMPSRRELVKITAAMSLTARLRSATPLTPLPSVTLDTSQATNTHEPFGDLAIYFNGSTDQAHSMTAGSLRLKPGMTPHPPHQHPEEEFMLVTEGTGEILVDGKTSKVAPGSMMYCGAGKLHAIVNTGKSPLLFYFYKWKV